MSEAIPAVVMVVALMLLFTLRDIAVRILADRRDARVQRTTVDAKLIEAHDEKIKLLEKRVGEHHAVLASAAARGTRR